MRLLVKRIISALITNVKRPSVRMVIGNVSRMRIGLIIALIIPSTKAARSALLRSCIWTAGIRYAAIIILNVLIIQLSNILILYYNKYILGEQEKFVRIRLDLPICTKSSYIIYDPDSGVKKLLYNATPNHNQFCS